MNKTLFRKFIYVIAVLAMLAMLIPAGTVSAANPPSGTPYLTMSGNGGTGFENNPGYNAAGSIVTVTYQDNSSSSTLGAWTLPINVAEPGTNSQAVFVGGQPAAGTPSVQVQGTWGDTVIQASFTSPTTVNGTATIEKKWGQIYSTAFTQPNTGSAVTWNEAAKAWSGNTTIIDTVTGIFYDKDPVNINNPLPGYNSHYFTNVMAGTVLKWYLIPGNIQVDMTPSLGGNISALESRMAGYQANGPVLTSFAPWTGAQVKQWSNVSGQDGKSPTVTIYAKGEEAVQIVVIPEYPVGTVNFPIVPEITTYDFYTMEMDVVPQVRWAGEKIVLEKNFGMGTQTYTGQWVKFSLQNQSVGSLEPLGNANDSSTSSAAVWTQVDSKGFASCILVSSDEGVAQVTAALYSTYNPSTGVAGILLNQHYFTVYYLKLESLTLGDVVGKRVGLNNAHDSGLWTVPNPYVGNGTADTTTQTLNVSADALMRANVKGWFTNFNPSARPARYVNPTNSSGMADPTAPYPANTLLLPAGRWILPDDWAALAGPNWQQSRLHWDIMNDPYGVFTATTGVGSNPWTGIVAAGATTTAFTVNNLAAPADEAIPSSGAHVWVNGVDVGPYTLAGTTVTLTGTPMAAPPTAGQTVWFDSMGIGDYQMPPQPPVTNTKLVGDYPVIGPFSPGLELMTPAGWMINPGPTWDPQRTMHTVVPDTNLDVWDAPMPPAKIIFQIQSAGATPNTNIAGFFKAVNKTDVYYVMVNGYKVYTNPFYKEMIPAHEAIPAFINNGGYDWNSFPSDGVYGPYTFWTIINQSTNVPQVATTDPSGHPTNVEVYSDNHGEAMVWLNGNWNLYLQQFAGNKGVTADIPVGSIVGTTTVQATADYPYARGADQALQSNKDVKTWLWTSSAGTNGLVYGQVLGTDSHLFPPTIPGQPSSTTIQTRMVLSAGIWTDATRTGTYPYETAKSQDEVVWVWVTDRDGTQKGVLGAEVDWAITGASLAQISPYSGALSQYNDITAGIFLDSGASAGFLANTGGFVTDGPNYQHGTSFLRAPTAAEKNLFNKFWGAGFKENFGPGYVIPPFAPIANAQTVAATSAISGLDPNNYVVAALDIRSLMNPYTAAAVTVNIDIKSHDFDMGPGQLTPGILAYQTFVDFNQVNNLDDGIRAGDANGDGKVDMADVVTIERMILGQQAVSTNAVINSDGTVDMGTVVKVERSILGLK